MMAILFQPQYFNVFTYTQSRAITTFRTAYLVIPHDFKWNTLMSYKTPIKQKTLDSNFILYGYV